MTCKICDIVQKHKKITRWFVPGEFSSDNAVYCGEEMRFHVIEDKKPYSDKKASFCVLAFWDKHKVAQDDSEMITIDQIARPFVDRLCREEGYKVYKIDRVLRSEPTHPHIQYCLR